MAQNGPGALVFAFKMAQRRLIYKTFKKLIIAFKTANKSKLKNGKIGGKCPFVCGHSDMQTDIGEGGFSA